MARFTAKTKQGFAVTLLADGADGDKLLAEYERKKEPVRVARWCALLDGKCVCDVFCEPITKDQGRIDQVMEAQSKNQVAWMLTGPKGATPMPDSMLQKLFVLLKLGTRFNDVKNAATDDG